jgi:hypothetical protein
VLNQTIPNTPEVSTYQAIPAKFISEVGSGELAVSIPNLFQFTNKKMAHGGYELYVSGLPNLDKRELEEELRVICGDSNSDFNRTY